MKVSIEPALCTLSLLLLYSSTITKATAQHPASESNDEPIISDDATLIARISINDRDQIHLRLPTDGSLTHRKLPAIDISSASVSIFAADDNEDTASTDATCFFWHHNRRGNAMSDDFVSPAFRPGEPLPNAYPRAERLYCYDSTRDRADNDVYALFLENLAGQRDLVRLRLQDEERSYGVLELRDVGSELGVNVRKAALVAGPALPENEDVDVDVNETEAETEIDDADVASRFPAGLAAKPFLNYCFALWEPGSKRFFTAANGVAFFPYKTLERIYCYKANMGYEDTIPFDELDRL